MTSLLPVREIRTRGSVHGEFLVPGSKSVTNRALVCASLARGESHLLHASDSDDTALMANGLNQMGVLVRSQEGDLTVSGEGGILSAPKFPIPVQNAGTTLRFLLSLAALARGRTRFEGSPRMAERPIDDLLSGLGALGVSAVKLPGGALYEVTGGTLGGGDIRLRADRSSQFLTSLLLVAPYAAGEVRITLEGHLASAPYVGMTIDVMRKFGAEVFEEEGGRLFVVRAGQRYIPVNFEVETDASGATYGMAAAAIAGGEILIPRLRMDSRQADIGFARILHEMGCVVAEDGGGIRVARGGALRGVDVDMNRLPDAVPTMVAVALFADGPSRIRNVAHLRFKESDRLSALEGEIRKLGAEAVIHEEGLVIRPAPLKGDLLETYDDHRLAMAFALIGLRVPGISVRNPGCVRKSFPRFWEEFEKL
jgi:3-phosphoshikimate 1-carboxyvinyltransferase